MPLPSSQQAEDSSLSQCRACRFCRARKIKCDKRKPSRTHKRYCVYTFEKPKPRPSSAIISAIQNEKRAIERIIVNLKISTPEEVASILDTVTVDGSSIKIQQISTVEPSPDHRNSNQRRKTPPPSIEKPNSSSATPLETSQDVEDVDDCCSDGEFDVSRYLSVDDQGQVGVFGLTSTLHNPGRQSLPRGPPSQDIRNQLVANAALERQKEFSIRLLPDIDRVPINLAMHLLAFIGTVSTILFSSLTDQRS